MSRFLRSTRGWTESALIERASTEQQAKSVCTSRLASLIINLPSTPQYCCAIVILVHLAHAHHAFRSHAFLPSVKPLLATVFHLKVATVLTAFRNR